MRVNIPYSICGMAWGVEWPDLGSGLKSYRDTGNESSVFGYSVNEGEKKITNGSILWSFYIQCQDVCHLSMGAWDTIPSVVKLFGNSVC